MIDEPCLDVKLHLAVLAQPSRDTIQATLRKPAIVTFELPALGALDAIVADSSLQRQAVLPTGRQFACQVTQCCDRSAAPESCY